VFFPINKIGLVVEASDTLKPTNRQVANTNQQASIVAGNAECLLN